MAEAATTKAKEKRPKPSGDHTSISNLIEVPEAILKPISQPPSSGKDPKTNDVNTDGTEAVTGYTPRMRLTESARAGLFTVPTTEEFRDIGEASFGTPPPIAETVHGPDDRVQITNITTYPWRAIASLLITAADNSTWIGTGWFIGPHTLVTAGHVVYIKNSGVPGRDGWVKRI